MLVTLAVAAQLCGACYMPKDQALRHAATKSVISAGTYVGLRTVGVPKTPALVGASVGVFLAGKAIERAKGHTFPRGDLVHDLGWHTLGVVPFARGRAQLGLGAGTIGLILFTRKHSAPRW